MFSRRCRTRALRCADVAVQQRQLHVNGCLDGRPVSDNDHTLGHSSAVEKEKENEKHLTPTVLKSPDLSPLSRSPDFVYCPACGKDITKFNTARRSAHVDRCLNMVDASVGAKKKRKRRRSAAQPSSCILDAEYSCPFCEIPLSSVSPPARFAHYKACAEQSGRETEPSAAVALLLLAPQPDRCL